MTFNRKIANLITTSGDLKRTAADNVPVLDSADAQAIVNALSVSVVDSVGALPVTGLTDGQRAFVPIDSSNSRLYLSNGSGWYNVALVNLSPSLTLSPSGAIVLATDGTVSTVTITANDSDQPEGHLTYSVDSDGNMSTTGTTVTQDSSVFTITPLTEDSGGVAGNFTLTFRISDQISQAFETKDFSITYSSIDSIFPTTGRTIYRIPDNNSGGSTIRWNGTGQTDGTTLSYSISGLASTDINNSLTGTVTWSSNQANFTPVYPSSWPSSAPNHAANATGSITAAGLSAPIYVKTYTIGVGNEAEAAYPFNSGSMISIGNYGSTTDVNVGTASRLYFYRHSNYTACGLMQRFLLAWTGSTNNTPAAGSAGSDVYYRFFKAIKIWGIINGTPTHTHTFSWAGTTPDMYASYGSSGSNYYTFLYDINLSAVSRDYTYSGYSNNVINNMYAIQYFSNAAATSLINTAMFNGGRGVII